MSTINALEETTPVITWEIVDNAARPFDLSELLAIVITVALIDKSTSPETVTLIRPSEQALNANGWRVYSSGGKSYLEWRVDPDITAIYGTRTTWDGYLEDHILRLEFYWGAERIESLTSPFETTSGSRVVTVHWVDHGLSDRDWIVCSGANNVAGIDFDGLYRVESVIDADAFTISHKSRTASASITRGGGNVTVWVNPYADRQTDIIKVKGQDLT